MDVRISDFVAWRFTVSHDQKGCILVGRIHEVMTIASACRECDAGAWPDRLASRIGDEDELALDDVTDSSCFVWECRAEDWPPGSTRTKLTP